MRGLPGAFLADLAERFLDRVTREQRAEQNRGAQHRAGDDPEVGDAVVGEAAEDVARGRHSAPSPPPASRYVFRIRCASPGLWVTTTSATFAISLVRSS